MYLITISFVLGICAVCWLSTLPVPAALLALPVGLYLLRWPRRRVLAALLLGFSWSVLSAALVQFPALDRAIEGRTVLVLGTVGDIPGQRTGLVQRFIFHVERLDDGSGWRRFTGKVRLGWYGDGDGPDAGERWQFAVRLKRPYGLANPGGFDYERWLFQQRIRATGYVREDPRNRRLSSGWLSPLANYRNRLIHAFERLSDTAGAGFVKALTVGERGDIRTAQWQVLNATGTSHLMAISGLHISLVAGLVFWLVRRGWSCLGRMAVRLPAPRAAAVAGLLAAVLYALLAGFGIPARRALVMVCALMLAILSDRYSSLAQVICLAALCTLALDPLSVLSAGWWLSFLAVFIIAWLATGRHGTQGRGRRRLLMHVALAVCMAPVLLLFFQQASLLAPLANVFAVPFVGLLIVPLALLGSLLFAVSETLGVWLLGLAAGMLELAWPVLQWLAGTGLAAWTRHQPPPWTLPPALAGLALLFMPRGVPGRWLGAVLLLPMLLVRPPAPLPGEAWITLLDVGQGLAAVVQTTRHTLVYDAGPRLSTEFDTGQAVVIPFLRRQGITRLDTLVVSHGDNDHIGGVPSVLAAYPPAAVYSSVPDQLTGSGATYCQRGQHWRWDGVGFMLLHPDAADGLTGNNASCVLRIEAANGQRLLLPGDIEHSAESRLVAEQRDRLPAQVLVAPHHGSTTSSSADFIAAVNPDVVIFPAAWLNRYRFPKREVVERYRAAGARVFETGRSGALSVKLSSSTAEPVIDAWRDRRRHIWSWRE
jgi:competence protein ComEC